jgi:Raf kinase inhibitor-like YbhB/YbcL family protein
MDGVMGKSRVKFGPGIIALLSTLVLTASVCNKNKGKGGEMLLTSTAFKNGEAINSIYTCDGKGESPHLAWKDVPEGTKTLALIMDDSDAPNGTFVHWVAWNIDPTKNKAELPKNASATSEGALLLQGTNSASELGYKGPCPPPGKLHHYFFRLYALSDRLDLLPITTKEGLLRDMAGKIIAKAQLMGTYQRK